MSSIHSLCNRLLKAQSIDRKGLRNLKTLRRQLGDATIPVGDVTFREGIGGTHILRTLWNGRVFTNSGGTDIGEQMVAGGVGEVGVEGGWLGVHRWFRDVIDDATMNALLDQEAKPFPMHFASSPYPG